jgi:hypothetical protein
VLGTTTALLVLGDDDAGEENLTYTWTATSLPPDAAAPAIQRQRDQHLQERNGHFLQVGQLHLPRDSQGRRRAHQRAV